MIDRAIEALRLFRQGLDTREVARIMHIRESDVCDLIHDARQAERFGGRDDMRIKTIKPPSAPTGTFGGIKRLHDAVARGDVVHDRLPISSAKPTLPRVKFLEGKEDVK